MLQRFRVAGLLCAGWAVAGCSSETRLEEFSGRTLTVDVSSIEYQERLLLNASLEPAEPPTGCPILGSHVEATLNGEPITVSRGGWAPANGGPVDPEVQHPGDRCVPPAAGVWLDAARFQGEPQDVRLEFRDGEQRMVVEVLNLFARHALVPSEPPLTVKPGQEVFLAWSPSTDDVSGITSVALNEWTQLPARPEAGGLRFTLPTGLSEGPATVMAVTKGVTHVPLLRCEGVANCVARVFFSEEQETVGLQVQP